MDQILRNSFEQINGGILFRLDMIVEIDEISRRLRTHCLNLIKYELSLNERLRSIKNTKDYFQVMKRLANTEREILAVCERMKAVVSLKRLIVEDIRRELIN